MKELNVYLMNALARLNDDKLMENYGEEEVRRTNAISKASQTVINNIKLKMNIKALAEKENKTIRDMETELDMYDD